MPEGYFGWKALTTPDSAPLEEPPHLGVGHYFPECRLMLLKYQKDRHYLELTHSEKSFTLEDVQSDFILIALYNEMCVTCVKEVEIYKTFYQLLLSDNEFALKLRMIGIGAGSKKRNVAKFRKQKNIPFPLFADDKWDIFNCLGEPTLPMTYLVQRAVGKRRIIMAQSGHTSSAEALLGKVKLTMKGDGP